ncbi:MAG TPA: ATP-binding protein [Longimicrobiaceae bacterium]|nr:ATP-binding protein [Longimicrobiaceae bacterium]
MFPASNDPAVSGPPEGADDASRAEFYRRQLETVANNATLALFIMDEHQQCTFMNPAAERLTGFTMAEVRGRALHDVIHHTRPDGTPYPLEECPIDQAFPRNLREQGTEVFVHRDGSFYPVAFTASPIRDGECTVGTIIEVRDVSAENAAAAERERLLRERERLLGELEAERTRLQQIFMHAPALISVTRGPEHVFELVNPSYRRMVGDRELLGKPLREALPELEGQGYFEMRDALYASGETHVQSEARVLADLDGDGQLEENFLNFVTQPLRDAQGRVDGILTFAVDVTEQVHARGVVEAQAAELEAQTEELHLHATRVEVLAEAGAVLGSAMELGTTLADLARVVVPRLADWYFVEVPAADGRIELAAVHHPDPARVEFAREALRRYPIDPAAPHGTARVLRTGEPELVTEIPDAFLEAVAQDAEHLALLRSVGFRSALSVPLSVRGRTLGVLSLVMAESGRRFTPGDLPLVEELGRRTALAVDNARLYAAERAAREDAEAANRAKTEFLSAMSHELRTPLNAIAGYVDLLDVGVHGPLTDPQRADLGRIKHAQGVLLGLISDILNFARIEAGRIEIAREPVPVATLLAELEGIVQPQVGAKGLSYEHEPAPAGLTALGDADRIRQILINLLSNAVKFTEPGGWIRVSAGAERGKVLVRVADSGRGIPPEKLEAVFEPFVQVDRLGSAESQQGVGLGLAISRELAHGMGGELRVESTLGAGSTFTLVLPAAPRETAAPGEA